MKKIFSSLVLVLMMIFATSTTTFAEPIPLRGVIEGFYGEPWTFADRESLMPFCRENKLNAYIYAPKDDLYHRTKWRESYLISPLSILSTTKKIPPGLAGGSSYAPIRLKILATP